MLSGAWRYFGGSCQRGNKDIMVITHKNRGAPARVSGSLSERRAHRPLGAFDGAGLFG